LWVFDRWSGIFPGAMMIQDVGSPEFGMPDSYTCNLIDGHTFKVHHSRVARFIGLRRLVLALQTLPIRIASGFQRLNP
jgi:hypothetical protein